MKSDERMSNEQLELALIGQTMFRALNAANDVFESAGLDQEDLDKYERYLRRLDNTAWIFLAPNQVERLNQSIYVVNQMVSISKQVKGLVLSVKDAAGLVGLASFNTDVKEGVQ